MLLLKRNMTRLLAIAWIGSAADARHDELSQPVHPAQPLCTLAVLSFDCSVQGSERLGAEIASALNAYLSKEEDLLTVERAELDKILSEQELGRAGLIDPREAAAVGQLSGAKVLITGEVFLANEEFLVVSKVIGTETGRVFGEVLRSPVQRSPAELARELADKTTAVLRQKTGQLLARRESPEERFVRWKQLVSGKRLPSISVEIAESHERRPVPDPAAETEVAHLLLELGFPLVDRNQASEPPQILITGEALSEFAGRRGNWISARGRVELKAVERASGKILAADRQTEVAVDLGEHVAGKVALQHCAAVLVERILQKLVPE